MKDIKQLAKRGDPPNTLIYIYCKYIKMAVTENCTGMHVPYVLKTKSLENFEEIFHLKGAIIRQIRAMKGILDRVFAKSSP